MSSKTVTRGSVALALAAFLSLASAAPSFAAPHHRSGERQAQAESSLWSFVINLTQDLVGRAFGFNWTQTKAVDDSDRSTTNYSLGIDPNGIDVAATPVDPSVGNPLMGPGR